MALVVKGLITYLSRIEQIIRPHKKASETIKVDIFLVRMIQLRFDFNMFVCSSIRLCDVCSEHSIGRKNATKSVKRYAYTTT